MASQAVFRAVSSPERLVHKVVDQIEQLIASGDLVPNMRLPSEREISEQFGVSRMVVREAVHILVTKGLLESRQGIGTIVSEVTQDQVTETFGRYLQSVKATLEHLHEVRSILEVEIARLAANQATGEEVRRLREILAEVEVPQDDVLKLVNVDEAFHRTLAQTSHNPLMVVLLDSIRDLMREVRLQVNRYPEVYNTIIPDHAAILRGIADRDPDAACRAMITHLDHAHQFQEAFISHQKTTSDALR
jgi:GntR family transcriptional repressor for pyruvate dehydrogenase complex